MPGSETPQKLALNLLATCKAVHCEAVGILYGQNKFQVDVRDFRCIGTPPEFASFAQITPYQVRGPKYAELAHDYKVWTDEAGRPGLSRTLSLMPAKYLALIRTWSFVYHAARRDCISCRSVADGGRVRNAAYRDLHVQLEILPVAPQFRLTVRRGTKVKRSGRGKRRALEAAVEPWVRSKVVGRSLGSLVRCDVLDLADATRRYCGHYHIGRD
ncbi:hypothetical protein LTR65_004301 [Meristemomyces frigidus]